MSKKHIFVILALLATIGVIIILLFNNQKGKPEITSRER